MTTTQMIRASDTPLVPAEHRVPLTLHVGGAGRALDATLSRHARWNESSKRFTLTLDVSDPSPGKAFELAARAALLGLMVRPHERTIQEAIRANPFGTAPFLLHIDDAASMTESADLIASTQHPIAGTAVLKSPSDRVFAFFFVVRPGDTEALARVRALLSVLARFQAPGGSGAVLGDSARVEHRVVEGSLRRWMAERVQANLPRVAAGLPLEEPTISLTEDGTSSVPLFVHEAKEFSKPRALAEVIAARGEWRVRLGAPVAIAEVTSDGLRFHRIRRRVLDRGLTVESTATILSEMEERRIAAERAAAAAALATALTRAERDTVNREAPILVTD